MTEREYIARTIYNLHNRLGYTLTNKLLNWSSDTENGIIRFEFKNYIFKYYFWNKKYYYKAQGDLNYKRITLKEIFAILKNEE